MMNEAPVRNSQLLIEIADFIKDEPERYDQSSWINVGDQYETDRTEFDFSIHVDGFGGEVIPYDDLIPACYSAFCIAGTALHLRYGFTVTPRGVKFRKITEDGSWERIDDVHVDAKAVLGLSQDEAIMLFASDWEPREGFTVSEALRAFATGADLRDVTTDSPFFAYSCYLTGSYYRPSVCEW